MTVLVAIHSHKKTLIAAAVVDFNTKLSVQVVTVVSLYFPFFDSSHTCLSQALTRTLTPRGQKEGAHRLGVVQWLRDRDLRRRWEGGACCAQWVDAAR